MYEKNYKTLMKDIKEELFMDKKTQYFQDVNSSKLHLLILYNPNQNPSKLFCGYQKLILKFI